MTLAALGLGAYPAVGGVPFFSYSLFLEPIGLERYWLVLLVPLVVAITVVYKAIKTEDLSQLPRRAGWLAGQIIGFMLLAGAVLWLVVRLVSS